MSKLGQNKRPVLPDNVRTKLEVSFTPIENQGTSKYSTTNYPIVERAIKKHKKHNAPIETAQGPSHASNSQPALNTEKLLSRNVPSMSKVIVSPNGSFYPLQDQSFNNDNPKPDLLAQHTLKRMPRYAILRSPESVIAECYCSSPADRYNPPISHGDAVQTARECCPCRGAYQRK